MMTKLRVLLILAVLGLADAASCRSVRSHMQPPPPPDAGGCDMQFLLSEVTPTIDGQLTGNEWNDAGIIESDGCINQLFDGQPNPDGTYSSNLQQGPVAIFTKRNNQNLYLAFSVTDATVATPNAVQPNGLATTIGDRIIIQFDPNHSGGATPQNDDFRLELVLYRNAVARVDAIWYQGDPAHPANPWQKIATNPGFIQAKCLSNAAQTSYFAEVQVLLGAGGLGYTLDPNDPKDMGIAVAVVNDLNGVLGLQDPENSTEAATGTAFPNLSYMPVTDAQHIIHDPGDSVPLKSTAWDTPKNWGTAFLAGAGDEIKITQSPAFWISDDIKVLFCRVTAPEDAPTPADFSKAPSRNTNGWYRYDNTLQSACPLYLMVQIRRDGGLTDPMNPGAAAVKKRVLSLWAQNGANPINWTAINLSGPIALQPGTGQPSNEYLAVTDFNWNNVPAKQTVGHPCIRVFILPEVLELPNTDPDSKTAFPTFNEDFFKSLGSEVATATKTAVQLNLQKFNAFVAAYGIPNSQVAQMNLDWLQNPTGQACPDCPPVAPRGGGVVRVAEALRRANAEVAEPPAARFIRSRLQNPVPEELILNRGTVVTASFTAYGYPRERRHRRFTLIESLGGVREAVDLSQLTEKGVVEVRFNVSNGNEYSRKIFLSSKLSVPGGGKGIGLRIVDYKPHFRPAETKTVVALIGPKVTSPPPGGYPPPPGKPLPPPGKSLPATGGRPTGQ